MRKFHDDLDGVMCSFCGRFDAGGVHTISPEADHPLITFTCCVRCTPLFRALNERTGGLHAGAMRHLARILRRPKLEQVPSFTDPALVVPTTHGPFSVEDVTSIVDEALALVGATDTHWKDVEAAERRAAFSLVPDKDE